MQKLKITFLHYGTLTPVEMCFLKNVGYDFTLNNDDVTTPSKMSESLRFFAASFYY